VDLVEIGRKSIFLTRPSLFDYKASRMELVLSGNEVFDLVKRGIFNVQINNQYRMEDAVEAHQNLQDRRTAGSSIFKLPVDD
jgi:NADPH2:quinone reductase